MSLPKAPPSCKSTGQTKSFTSTRQFRQEQDVYRNTMAQLSELREERYVYSNHDRTTAELHQEGYVYLSRAFATSATVDYTATKIRRSKMRAPLLASLFVLASVLTSFTQEDPFL